MNLINQLRKRLNRKAAPEIQREIERVAVSHEERMRLKYSRTVLKNAEGMRDRIEQLIKEGFAFSEIKSRLGASHAACINWMEILQLTPPKKTKKQHPLLNEIRKSRENGLKYAEIGRILGVTRERVRQIVAEQAPELTTFNYARLNPEDADLPDPSTSRKKKKSPLHIDRDFMMKVIELRKRSMTWNQVADQLCPGMEGVILRVQLQRWIDIILTKAEREEFFPAKGQPHYRA